MAALPPPHFFSVSRMRKGGGNCQDDWEVKQNGFWAEELDDVHLLNRFRTLRASTGPLWLVRVAICQRLLTHAGSAIAGQVINLPVHLLMDRQWRSSLTASSSLPSARTWDAAGDSIQIPCGAVGPGKPHSDEYCRGRWQGLEEKDPQHSSPFITAVVGGHVVFEGVWVWCEARLTLSVQSTQGFHIMNRTDGFRQIGASLFST